MSTLVLSATDESPCMANAISRPSGATATSPSPLVAMVGTSWSIVVMSLAFPARVTRNRCPRFPARDRQHPELGTVLSGGDECERRAVGGPARLPVGARALRKPAGLPGPELREPDTARPAIVLERVFRQGVGDPFAVRGKLRIAHGLHRYEVVKREGALLGGKAGKRGKGKGNRERQDRDQAFHASSPDG